MKNKGVLSRCVKVLLILVLVLNVTMGCSMKKITTEQADSLLLAYCDILQEKAKTYGGTISFNPIVSYDSDSGRSVEGEISIKGFLMDVDLNCWYNEKFIHFYFDHTYGGKFGEEDILETRKIMLDFVNEISVRQYTDSQLQEFMDDASNVTWDTESALMKEKIFDFYGYEMFIYQKNYEQPGFSGYEALIIKGKTKNFR